MDRKKKGKVTYMPIDHELFIHESDRAALNALKAIPGFTQVLRSFMKVWNEKQFKLLNMSTFVKVSEEQMSKYHDMLIPICKKLNIAVPELYVSLSPVANAYTSGDTEPFIVMTSGLINTVPEELIPTVLAHECGHIACHHVLYSTMGRLILGGATEMLGLSSLITTPLQMAFYYFLGGNARSVDLTDVVYHSKVPGEDITVYDKLRDDWKAQTAYYSVGENSFSGNVPYKTYDFLWGSGMMGIVYNEELYKSFGYDVPPRTSEELIEVSNKIKEGNDKYKEGYTYMYSAGGDYMGYLYQIWWGQYEGIDNIYNYYQGIGFDGENYVEKSSDIFKQVGRKEAMNELIKLSMKENGLRYARGAATDFKAAQKFYFQGKGVFMCNGDWLAEENKEDLAASPYHFKMMKTPIISSIRQKTPSIPDDATLRKVVQAIDDGKTFGMANIDGVTEADYQTIMDARGVTLSLGAGFHSCIPSYAAGKDVAVDFLRFMATDKAQEIYAKATGGATLPFKYKMSDKAIFNDFSDLQKSVIDMREKSIYNSTCMPLGTNMPLVKFGNLGIWTSYALNGAWDINYAQNGSLDPKNEWSAQAAYDRDIDYWTNNNGEKWNNALRLAGFIK